MNRRSRRRGLPSNTSPGDFGSSRLYTFGNESRGLGSFVQYEPGHQKSHAGAEQPSPLRTLLPAPERQGDGFGTQLQVAAANFVGDGRVLWSVVGIMAVQRVLAGSIYFMENSSGVWSTLTLVP
jgi:hypothetical protein